MRLKRARIKAYYAISGYFFDKAEDLEWSHNMKIIQEFNHKHGTPK